MEDDTPKNGIQRNVDIAAFISDKMDFKTKKVNMRKRQTFYNDKMDN